MKTLPDNPSLEHLRRQAKDLLVGLRDTNPATSLHDAQSSLAQQYGFDTWAALNAEVQRLQGNADVCDPAPVAERFGLGSAVGEMRSVAPPDHLGRLWSLRTNRGRFAVRTVENWIPIVDAEAEVALQEKALAAGVLLPAPVRSIRGGIVEAIAGKTWRVNEWRHSGPPLSAPASSTVTQRVGEILATIHGLAIPVDRISPWHAVRFGDAFSLDLGPAKPIPRPVLTHNSLIPGNVRLGGKGQLIVFGWSTPVANPRRGSCARRCWHGRSTRTAQSTSPVPAL